MASDWLATVLPGNQIQIWKFLLIDMDTTWTALVKGVADLNFSWETRSYVGDFHVYTLNYVCP